MRFKSSRWIGLGASVLLLCNCILPTLSFAERISPQIDWNAPSEALNQPQDLTQVQDLMPLPDHFSSVQMVDSPVASEAVPTLKARVNVEKEFVPDVVFGDSHTIPKGQKLVLTIMDMVATGYNEVGDEFHARVKEDVTENGELLIPSGALVKGHISQIDDPGKAFSKRGKMILTFDYILMPDGRKIPFKSEYGKGDNALSAVGRAVGGGVGGTIVGAVRGAIIGLQYGGLFTTALTHGASMLIPGGIGAVAGLGGGLAQGGDHVILKEGDSIQVGLDEPLKLLSMKRAPDTQNEIHAPGLDVTITAYNLGRDPFKIENQIVLGLKIDNQTPYTFGSFDMGLEDEYKNFYAVSPFGEDNTLIMRIEPNRIFNGQIGFSVKSPEVRHYLVFYKPYTRDVIAKISLTEALKKLAKTGHSKTLSHHHKDQPASIL